jgi:hypothetical protein
MDTKQYRGVVYIPGNSKPYAARVVYKSRKFWLKTWATAYEAAQIRDVAAKWLRDSKTKLNSFQSQDLPKGVTEVVIARWLVEAGIPVRVLAYKVPLSILAKAGVTQYQLLQGGVSAGRILQFTDASNHLAESCTA